MQERNKRAGDIIVLWSIASTVMCFGGPEWVGMGLLSLLISLLCFGLYRAFAR